MKKFLSRKFLLSLISMLVGIAGVLSDLGGRTGLIAGIILAVASPITYIITEGVLDAKAIQLSSQAVNEVSDILNDKNVK
ncbi:MAG: hypothetical protein Q4B04_03915 [bacterium]|nr:hypothetical protein [bacterium]